MRMVRVFNSYDWLTKVPVFFDVQTCSEWGILLQKMRKRRKMIFISYIV